MNSEEKWVEAGYALFAQEGPEGLQVERLARILGLNKSGFYHYFGDTESYFKQLVKHHYRMADRFLSDVAACQNIDPEYLNVLLKHQTTVMGQIHLVRNQTHPSLYGAYKAIDGKVGPAVLKIWAEYVELPYNLDLALTYWGIVRDMFYCRMNYTNFNYDFLHDLAGESRDIVIKIFNERDSLVDKS